MTSSQPQRPWPPCSDQAYREEVQTRLGAELAARFGNLKLLVFDADGILTSGELIYGPDGEAMKQFHARDGLGLVMARVGGIKLAVLTGRNSRIVERRATELRFDAIKLGRFDKVTALHEILAETEVSVAETLYMGDDLIDLPALCEAGVSISVPEAPSEVLDAVDLVTAAPGGAGAVREITDLVLKASGLYGQALTRLADKAWMPSQQELSSDAGGPSTETGSKE